MEEFLKQAREFDQSFWGGLFYFLVGVVFATYPFFQTIQSWRLWLAVLHVLFATGWTVQLALREQLPFAGLLALVVLASIARTIAMEVQKRRQKA